MTITPPKVPSLNPMQGKALLKPTIPGKGMTLRPPKVTGPSVPDVKNPQLATVKGLSKTAYEAFPAFHRS